VLDGWGPQGDEAGAGAGVEGAGVVDIRGEPTAMPPVSQLAGTFNPAGTTPACDACVLQACCSAMDSGIWQLPNAAREARETLIACNPTLQVGL